MWIQGGSRPNRRMGKILSYCARHTVQTNQSNGVDGRTCSMIQIINAVLVLVGKPLLEKSLWRHIL
jgi:hypothetical protein